MKVPNDLICLFSKKIIKKSLKTIYYKDAKVLSASLHQKIKVIYLIARTKLLSDTQIKSLISCFINKTLKDSEDCRINGIGIPKNPKELADKLTNIEETILGYKTSLIFNEMEYVRPKVDQLLEGLSVKLDDDPLVIAKLCREILKALIDIATIEKERTNGNYDNWYDMMLKKNDMQLFQCNNHIKPISEVIQNYMKEKEIKKSWTIKTKIENESIFKIFTEIVGDKKIGQLDREDFINFAEILGALPANINKKKEYKGKSIANIIEIVKKNPVQPISIRTRNKYCERISSLMDWAEKQCYVNRNFAKGLSVKEDNENDKRDPYSADDIVRLLNTPIYTKRIPVNKPERFWIPLIALFMGLRIDEICQLYVEDIIESDGIWCIDINDNNDKKLKTSSSKRKIPIHPSLIKIGFMEYVEKMANAKALRLWLNLKKDRDGYSHYFGKWFQRFNRKNITQDPRKVFHSFRHAFSDNLKQQGIETKIIDALLWHKDYHLSTSTYAKPFSPGILLHAISKVNYKVDRIESLKFPQ